MKQKFPTRLIVQIGGKWNQPKKGIFSKALNGRNEKHTHTLRNFAKENK